MSDLIFLLIVLLLLGGWGFGWHAGAPDLIHLLLVVVVVAIVWRIVTGRRTPIP